MSGHIHQIIERVQSTIETLSERWVGFEIDFLAIGGVVVEIDMDEGAEGVEAKGVKVEADVEVVMDVSVGDLGDGSGRERDFFTTL